MEVSYNYLCGYVGGEMWICGYVGGGLQAGSRLLEGKWKLDVGKLHLTGEWRCIRCKEGTNNK